MATKKKPKKKDEKPQSERFKETARMLEVDESGKTFERAFKRFFAKRRVKASEQS